MFVLLTYKQDVESKDDHQLAILEVTSLAGQPVREVSSREATELLSSKKLPFLTNDRRIFVADVTTQLIERLLRRLAFWDFLLVRANDQLNPKDLAIGNAWYQFGDILAFATQSQVLEWTAYAKD